MPGDVAKCKGGDAEAFGLVFLEAAACGTPSIACYLGRVSSAIAHNLGGLLVPPNDEEGFVRGIRNLLYRPIG